MKTIYKLLGFITFGIILVSSCVNDEYDLKKELDAVQKIIDKAIKEIDDIVAAKDKEILEV